MKSENMPLYKKIVMYVKSNISSGAWEVDTRIPSERELSEMFGVSSITSKRALLELEKGNIIYRIKGSGSYVKSGVEKAMEEKALFSFEGMIGLVVPREMQWVNMKDYLTGINDYLNSKNYEISIHASSADNAEGEVLRSIINKKISGIIFYPYNTSENADLLISTYARGIPLVLIDKKYDSVPISSVTSDNYSGGYMQTEYLLKAGHKQIAYLSSVPTSKATSVRDRYLGYCSALKDYNVGLNQCDYILLDCQNDKARTEEVDYDTMCERYKEKIMLIYKSGVTAFICSCDILARNIYMLLEEIGLNVPEDVSIAGVDVCNAQYSLGVQITGIEQDFYTIGYKAAEILTDQINGKTRIENVQIPVTMYEGNTVKVLTENSVSEVGTNFEVEIEENIPAGF